MMNVLDIFTVISTAAGIFFFFAGTAGLLRFPDVFSRLHALTKADNLGLGLITIGLVPQVAHFVDGIQLIITWILVMLAGAVSSFLVANYQLSISNSPTRKMPRQTNEGSSNA